MKKLFTTGLVAGAFAATVGGAIAGPLMLSPVSPMVPKVLSMPVVKAVPIQVQVLNSYRQLRSFWVSRAIVR